MHLLGVTKAFAERVAQAKRTIVKNLVGDAILLYNIDLFTNNSRIVMFGQHTMEQHDKR
jgi:hypothetical protein